MPEPSSSLTGILDIAPPVAPASLNLQPGVAFGLFVLLALSITLLIAYLLWRRRHSPRGQAQHQLTRLWQQHQQQHISAHQVAFRLAAILRNGLRLPHIASTVTLPATLQSQQARWHEFSERLHRARYASEEADADQLALLFRESRFWLRSWP
jgi:hypothetical protein